MLQRQKASLLFLLFTLVTLSIAVLQVRQSHSPGTRSARGACTSCITVLQVRQSHSPGAQATEHNFSQDASPITPTSGNTWNSHVMAWIYPGNPACNAPNEYEDGRGIDTLKPQYYTLENTGVLELLTVSNSGCNAYSPANASQIKQYSTHQYVTISGNPANMSALVMSQENITIATNTLVNFLEQNKFTGVEIDFEGFARWTFAQYAGYKSFLTKLGDILHSKGFKLMIDGPAVIVDSGIYQWHYADFNALPVDYIVVMEYDWQYDFGVGTPVSPLSRMEEVTKGVLARITDPNKVVIGMPSYGYHGPTGTSTITIDTNAQSQTYAGYSAASRDSSSDEMMWTRGNTWYDYSDSISLNDKRTLLESLGVKFVSVWHLGGNQWFSGKPEPPPSP